jgi:two-component system chemotaxis response regulator CheB
MRDPPTRFRCHVGHAYSLHTLFSEQNVHVEAALWAAVRALDQVAHIARRLADHAQRTGRPKSAQTFTEQADDSARHADRLRELLEAGVETASSAG